MELQEIAKIARKVRFGRSEIISGQDGESRNVFVLIDGSVDIVSLNGVPLYRVATGETFGELAMVPGLKRTARAVSRDDSWVVVLNMAHLESLGEEFPSILRTVSDNIVRSLGIKLARANKLIELLKSELGKALRNNNG